VDADDPSVAQVDAVNEEINELLLANGITASFTNWMAFQESITSFILVFNIILYLAAALIAAVGAIGLLTSLSMSVFERQKEIGVMRSVGATSGTVAVQFLVEGLTVGVAAWAMGIPFGYLISRGLTAALPFETFGIGFPPQTVVFGLAGMLAVVTIASLWPSLAAARKTVSDILRYQ
jgi:putative ABC transport system permease protein